MNEYKLYDFQERGVEFLREHGNIGLLGDEMGLGKTAQALSAIRPLVLEGKHFVILVPGATIIQWQKNWDRWILDCEPDPFCTDGLFAVRSSSCKIPNDFSVVMSHSLLTKKAIVEQLIEKNFDGIIIDEIHKFGAESSKRLTHLRALCNLTKSKFKDTRIALSGTPVRNYAKEIFNVAHFLAPHQFRTREAFYRQYLTFDGRALYNPHKFHEDFREYYLRRTVSEVQKYLPVIRQTKVYTELTNPFIKSAYNKNVDLMANFVEHAPKVDAFSLLGYLIKLRQITGLAKAAEPAIIDPIKDYLNDGKKAVIGIHHRAVSERLKNSLRDFNHIYIRGGMSDIEKEIAKQGFIAAPPGTICQLSIKAAAEGIDGLQYAANKAWVFERQWNSADEQQFVKRIHRTGQKLPVDIEQTIAVGTVDEYFDEMCEYKKRITTQVEDQNWETNPVFLRELAQKVIRNKLK